MKRAPCLEKNDDQVFSSFLWPFSCSDPLWGSTESTKNQTDLYLKPPACRSFEVFLYVSETFYHQILSCHYALFSFNISHPGPLVIEPCF